MSRGLRWGLCRLVSGVGPVGLYRRLRSSEPFSRLSRIAAFLAVALTFTSGATRTATSRRTEGRRSFGGASPTVPRLSTTGVALSLRTCPVAGGRVNPACTAWASCPTRLYGSGLVGRLAGGTRRTLHTHRWAGRHSDQLLCGVVAGRRLSTVSTPCHSNGVARHHHTTTQRTYCHGCSSYTPVDAARHGHHRGGRQTGATASTGGCHHWAGHCCPTVATHSASQRWVGWLYRGACSTAYRAGLRSGGGQTTGRPTDGVGAVDGGQ